MTRRETTSLLRQTLPKVLGVSHTVVSTRDRAGNLKYEAWIEMSRGFAALRLFFRHRPKALMKELWWRRQPSTKTLVSLLDFGEKRRQCEVWAGASLVEQTRN